MAELKLKKRLPKKLSALLRAAVCDAKAAERMDGVSLNMRLWFVKANDGTCAVCMAGACLLRRGSDLPAGVTKPWSYDHETFERLTHIDGMRTGYLGAGVSARVQKEFLRIVTEGFVGEAGRASWATYLEAADYLEAEGL